MLASTAEKFNDFLNVLGIWICEKMRLQESISDLEKS